MHKTNYTASGSASSKNRRPKLVNNECGRTSGCLGVSERMWDDLNKKFLGTLHKKIDEENGKKIGDESGHLLYTFGPYQAKRDDSYCGGSDKWIK